VLGDVIFKQGDWENTLDELSELPGDKILVRGNHDDFFSAWDLLPIFQDVHGLLKYKGHWLSHAPIHPDELRGAKNLHGHVHGNSLKDNRYYNCCIENVGYAPKCFQEIKEELSDL
jgi:calcineurin-like phosphoesterase family protein